MLTGPEGGAARALGYRAPPGILVDTRQTWGLQGSHSQPAPMVVVAASCSRASLLTFYSLSTRPRAAVNLHDLSQWGAGGKRVRAPGASGEARRNSQLRFSYIPAGRSTGAAASQRSGRWAVGAACRTGGVWCVQP